LGAIGDARAVRPLEKLLATEKVELVRQAAAEALEKIKGAGEKGRE
jgi:HEAT repeat protein